MNQYKVLEKLEENSVMGIEPRGEMFVLSELCDHYYDVSLTRDELLRLGWELILMATPDSDAAES